MKLSDQAMTVASPPLPQCVQCSAWLPVKSASPWWCSEDCFFEWQRTRHVGVW